MPDLIRHPVNTWILAFARMASCDVHNCRNNIITPNQALIAMIVAFSLLAHGTAQAREVRLSGSTMGTTYQIKVVTGAREHLEELQQEIETCLQGINASMSTYLPESEISRFNHLAEVGQSIKISANFYEVLETAGRLFRITEGAWDGTVGPLVNLWGFGAPSRKPQVPEPQAIQRARTAVGFGRIQFRGERCIAKGKPKLYLDLASIAKGYGVDAVARIIARAGWRDYLVEIGGEVYAAGKRPDGTPWRVGINLPLPEAAPTDLHQVVALENMALATSGDYRNFFEINGVRYSHIIDPRSGYPLKNGVVSATVLAGDCTWADGLATALMVMGPDSGLPLVHALPGVECLIIVREDNGELINHPSAGFGAYLDQAHAN
jgi:thiamine biosynthesis lipoprotein